MARLTKPLTDTEIKTAKPKEVDYTLHDGDGRGRTKQGIQTNLELKDESDADWLPKCESAR